MQFSETLTEKHVCGHLCTTRSSSAATTVGHPRTSSWSAGIPARIALPITPHHKTCQDPGSAGALAGPSQDVSRQSPALPGGPHPGPRASLPASLCPPRHITRRVTSRLSTEADVREISLDCILWNPPGEGAGTPRGPHPGPRASLPASLCPSSPVTRRVTPSLSTEADVS